MSFEKISKLRIRWRFLANTGLRMSEFSVLPVTNVDTADKDPKARVRVVHDPDAGLKVKRQRPPG